MTQPVFWKKIPSNRGYTDNLHGLQIKIRGYAMGIKEWRGEYVYSQEERISDTTTGLTAGHRVRDANCPCRSHA